MIVRRVSSLYRSCSGLGAAATYKSYASPRIAFFLLLVLAAPHAAEARPAEALFDFDFRQGALGWQADFADYAADQRESYELEAGVRALPPEVGVSGTGFYVQGHNRSDDLFMFLKRRLTAADGVVPGQRYQVFYALTLASNAQSGCTGAGGAPGEGVVIKAGATPNEPRSIPDGGGYHRMNVNIGSQSHGASAASVAGNIANGLPCHPASRPFVSIQRTHQHTAEVTATSGGELWLLVRIDSGYEGLTRLYYRHIAVRLVPVGAPSPAVPALLAEEETGRAVALDSVTMTRDPFRLDNEHYLGHDRRTRLSLFATGVELMPGEGASAVTAHIEDMVGRIYPAEVEYAGPVPGHELLTQIVIRLPDGIPSVGRLWVAVSVRGAASNAAPFFVSPS